MSRLDDLQIARCEVVENAAILRGRIRDLNVQLKSTLPYSEYTRAADERAIFVDALQALERKAGELNREIRDERARESSAESGVSLDDTAALLRVAAEIIGQIDADDLTDAERAFLCVLQQRVQADRDRLRRSANVTTNVGALLRRGRGSAARALVAERDSAVQPHEPARAPGGGLTNAPARKEATDE